MGILGVFGVSLMPICSRKNRWAQLSDIFVLVGHYILTHSELAEGQNCTAKHCLAIILSTSSEWTPIVLLGCRWTGRVWTFLTEIQIIASFANNAPLLVGCFRIVNRGDTSGGKIAFIIVKGTFNGTTDRLKQKNWPWIFGTKPKTRRLEFGAFLLEKIIGKKWKKQITARRQTKRSFIDKCKKMQFQA